MKFENYIWIFCGLLIFVSCNIKQHGDLQISDNLNNYKIRFDQLRCYKQAELDAENQIVDGTKKINTEKGNIVQLRDIVEAVVYNCVVFCPSGHSYQ
jgi:hypothetical protein